jgi:ribosomal protein S18 acetylase RimI-like enzyme
MLTLRSARGSDVEGIARVYVETWRSTYPGLVPNRVLVRMSVPAQVRQWSAVLSQTGTSDSVVVAEMPARGIVGFGSCGEARVTALPQAGEIFTLYVAPEQQGNGIGQALLYRLFDALIDQGLNSALAWVLSGNPSRFFYEAMAARPVAVREERLWDTSLPQTAYGWDDVGAVPRHRNVRTG